MPIDIHHLPHRLSTAILSDSDSSSAQGAGGDAHKLSARDLEPFRNQRLLAKRYLPFLKTLADFDIAAEIGFHELSLTPLTVKQLLLLEVAPPVTVFRRLNRLCDLGVIIRTRSPRDRRVHELRLSPAVHRLFAMYSHQDGS
jgi:hypothetical protein